MTPTGAVATAGVLAGAGARGMIPTTAMAPTGATLATMVAGTGATMTPTTMATTVATMETTTDQAMATAMVATTTTIPATTMAMLLEQLPVPTGSTTTTIPIRMALAREPNAQATPLTPLCVMEATSMLHAPTTSTPPIRTIEATGTLPAVSKRDARSPSVPTTIIPREAMTAVLRSRIARRTLEAVALPRPLADAKSRRMSSASSSTSLDIQTDDLQA